MTTVMTRDERELKTLELIDNLATAVDTVNESVQTLSKIVQILDARISKLEGK